MKLSSRHKLTYWINVILTVRYDVYTSCLKNGKNIDFFIPFFQWFKIFFPEFLSVGTILYLSPSNGVFFLPFFQASFNLHVGPTRHLRFWIHFSLITFRRFFTIFPDWIYKTFKTFTRMHLSFFLEF